jgi:hypothetical protein
MIVELDSLRQFDEAIAPGSEAIFPDYKEFSTPSMGIYNPNIATNKIRNFFVETLAKGDVLPYFKIFVYTESEDPNDTSKYTCVHIWQGYTELLTNERMFSEILWQSRGMNVSTITHGKAMLSLLKHAEKYAKNNGFHSLVLTRDPNLHMLNKENQPLNITNYFTRSGYDPCIIKYVKKLK